MKQQIKLQIPEPCHENWNNMSATEQGRFCMACKKEVIDFSTMSDKEILQHIATATSSVCGRASNAQLNRPLNTAPEPRKTAWRYWMGIAASLVMMVSRTNAQKGEIKIRPIVTVPKLPGKNFQSIVMGKMMAPVRNEMIVRGRITDGNGIGIAYASVEVKSMGLGIATDSTGNFVLHLNNDQSGQELVISSVGYQSKTIEVDKLDKAKNPGGVNAATILAGDIVLRGTSMDEVVVTGYTTQGKYSFVAGGVTAVRCRSTKIEKAKIKLKEMVGLNELKIYPNPIGRNADFNICFNLKKQGEYTVQFADASGKILPGRKINIVSNNYTERFNGSMFGASGIYFVHVSGKDAGSNYTGKLIVP